MSAARPARVRRTQPTTGGWIALIVFLFLAGLGAIAALATVGAYNALASDLPDPKTLESYALPEETVVYDRTGKVELARFGDFKREVVKFDEIPKVLIDATTAVEDKTFWDNAGFDPVAILSAGISSLRGDSRGASTITQQLVRARLLPEDLVADPHRTAERKLKEIIQSVRLTQAYEGQAGKQAIITAYLNQNYYGNQTYGVKAAAETYFGIPLDKIDPAQAAIIAGLPKSPSNYDLVRNAIEECKAPVAEGEDCPAKDSTLVVPHDTTVVERRDQILELMRQSGRTPLSGDQYTPADFKAAENEPVTLAPQVTPNWIAPHFVWAVRDELAAQICDGEQSCDRLDQGGLRVTTTLDANLQKIAEKWVKAAAIVPKAKDPTAAARALGFKKLEPWMANLRNKNLRNGALVAVDYQTGELVAYVGSANYYATSTRPEFQPQYDVAGKGYRQPGSAFKPFNYVTAINDRKITAGTMLMDVGTDFGGKYTPADADNLERGPVRVRNALQFSLNIPAVKTAAINTPQHVIAKAQDFGMVFQGKPDVGVAVALGVQEVRPVDLVSAYGALADGGKAIPHTTILTIQDRNGKDVVPPYQPPAGKQVVSPQAAYIVTDILSGNTNPKVNPFWGKFSVEGPGGGRRPATLKTGTNNDAKDLNAYGYIAPPTDAGRQQGAYALAVGVWNGNSDNSLVSTASRPLFSIDVSTYVWQGFLQEASAKWPITNFARPKDGLVQAKIDPFTGFRSNGRNAVDEWYIAGTEPKDALPTGTCGVDVIAAVHVETGFDSWMQADRDWLRRAARGPGVSGGPDRNRTAYFYNGLFHPYGSSWGVVVGGTCGQPSAAPSCFVVPTPDASGVVPSFAVPTPDPSSGIAAAPCPPASAAPSTEPSLEPSLEPTPAATEPPPTEKPTPTPKDNGKPTPTPELTPPPPGPSAEPSAGS
jgi:peptidoglycan glycosyltransferase